MGENKGKLNKSQRINFQNKEATHTIPYKKNKQPIKTQGKYLKRIFSKEDMQMANKRMKRC